MERTITTHNGNEVCREHNIRVPYVVAKESHINPELCDRNEILVDIPPKQAYEELFDDARKKYNQRMIESGHPERQIEDYFAKIRKDKKKHAVYEMIVQIGNRDSTGVDGTLERECLKEFINGWEERNPNLKLIGAYIHADEDNGTLHAHLDYIPVAHNCGTGMKTQTALVRALGEQGFTGVSTKQTAQIAWEKRENQTLEQICVNHGITVVHPNAGEPHRNKKQFIVYQKQLDGIREQIVERRGASEQLDEALNEKTAALSEITAELDKNSAKISQIRSIDEIETGKTMFGGKVTLSKEDYGTLTDLAKKQIAAENQEDFLKRRITTLEVEKKSLSSEKERLSEQVAELKEENGYLQSVNGKIAVATLRSERDNLQRKLDRVMEFIKSLGLAEKLQAFLRPNKRLHK